MKRWLTLVFALCAPLVTGLGAQQNQPIYPAYDGFLKNPDGSYTIAFAYFSHNASDVTIAPGANNSFAPTPGDRDRKSTRLNSSHSQISYAVFCLKKKKKKKTQ